jgi:ADP-ribosylglycohydrolase
MEKNKINNLLLGFAIGDAFGAGVEFQDRDWIRANVKFDKLLNVRYLIQSKNIPTEVFTKDYQAWDYTDDTEMLLGMSHLLLSDLPFSEENLIQTLTDEYQKGKAQKGFGRNGHGSMRWVFEGEKTIDEVRFFQANRENPGNAPTSRAAILGFLPKEKIEQFAITNANATHPHPKTQASSLAIALATHFLLVEKKNQANLLHFCSKSIEKIHEPSAKLLLTIDELPNYEALQTADFELLCGKQPIEEPYFLPNINGLPSDAMYTMGAALYVLKHATSAMDALKMSILMGGDTDSLASICTGIAASKFGLDSLPNFMLDQVEGKDYLTKMANLLSEKWKKY